MGESLPERKDMCLHITSICTIHAVATGYQTYPIPQKMASDAGAVEEVCIELGFSHMASVLLDKFLNSMFSPHMRWLVGVCFKPFPPAD